MNLIVTFLTVLGLWILMLTVMIATVIVMSRIVDWLVKKRWL